MKAVFAVLFTLVYGMGCGGKKSENPLLPEDFPALKALADKGDVRAQHKLGLMFQLGEGVEQSDKKALMWVNKAADQKYAPAQYDLGAMYEGGLWVKQDFKKALKWYRLAADQNDPQAQASLGYMYAEGRGVKKNIEVAYVWYSIAAANDNAGASTLKGIIAKEMTPEQTAKAEAMLKEKIKRNPRMIREKEH